MIILGDALAPVWLKLEDDVELLTRLHEPLADIAGTQAYHAALAAGGDPARARLAEIVAMALVSVADWRGVQHPDGTPAPLTPENLEQLFRSHRTAAVSWGVRRLEGLEAWADEKKDFAALPSGTGTAALSSATAATSPAAADSAPSLPPPPAAAKGPPSGGPSPRRRARYGAPNGTGASPGSSGARS